MCTRAFLIVPEINQLVEQSFHKVQTSTLFQAKMRDQRSGIIMVACGHLTGEPSVETLMSVLNPATVIINNSRLTYFGMVEHKAKRKQYEDISILCEKAMKQYAISVLSCETTF